jgi:hypothetical protein
MVRLGGVVRAAAGERGGEGGRGLTSEKSTSAFGCGLPALAALEWKHPMMRYILTLSVRGPNKGKRDGVRRHCRSKGEVKQLDPLKYWLDENAIDLDEDYL